MPPPNKTTTKDPNDLTVEELQALLKSKADEEAPALKEEVKEHLTQAKEKIARLKMLGISLSIMGLMMNISDEEKTKVRDALVKEGKPMSKTDLARKAGFANEKGQASSKFGEVLKVMEEEGDITITEAGNKKMVALPKAA